MKTTQHQNFFPALFIGLALGSLTASLWALFTYAIGYRTEFMAIGTGAIIGLGMSTFSQGRLTALASAVLTLIFAMLGNFMGELALTAYAQKSPFIIFLSSVASLHPYEALRASFEPSDVIFYFLGMAIGFGFPLPKEREYYVGDLYLPEFD